MLTYPLNISIDPCNEKHFRAVKQYISDFELDDRILEQEEFIVASQEQELLGFGRIRKYEHCDELCSLGVVEPQRYKGIGSALTKALIKRSSAPLYLVCVIPSFFEPLGFATCENYPAELQQKLDYCNDHLTVAETYVVMKKN